MSFFFPDPVFGWTYLASLFAILAVAAWKDLRAMVIPKGLTVPALALGVLFNVVRGSWLASEGHPAWLLGDNGPLVGGLDGLLFALLGFAAAFGLFFLMWLLNVCGGGDVKLFAALGAWIGPELTLRVLIATLFVVCCFILGRLVGKLFSGDWKGFRAAVAATKIPQRSLKVGSYPRKRALGFALPLVIAAALVLPWSFRVDLRMANASPQGETVKEQAHAR